MLYKILFFPFTTHWKRKRCRKRYRHRYRCRYRCRYRFQ